MLKSLHGKSIAPPMLHYLHDTNKTTLTARITGVGEDAKGSYLLLDETIFYPQGGTKVSYEL